MQLYKSVSTIGSLTIISRVFGYVRDWMMAALLGAGMLSDAFLVAFKLPNFMRRLFAEGAFNSGFVPLYSRMLVEKGDEEAREFATEVFSFLFWILVALTIVMEIFMPIAMVGLAPGFEGEKFDLSVTLTRITFPYLLFIALVSLQGGILNSRGKFWAVAATPIIMNLSLILTMLTLSSLFPTPAHALSVGVMISGIAQFLWLFWFCRKEGINPKLRFPRLTAGVKRLLKVIAPAAIGAGVAQINLFVDIILASFLPTAVSFLYYADRINELPLGVIGVAVGTALLPTLTKHLRAGEIEEMHRTHNRALEIAMLFSLPACLALVVLALPIVKVLFEYGKFTPEDSLAVSYALAVYALGLPAFVMNKVFAPGFFAHEDTKTPMHYAVICIVLNLVLNLILMWPLKHVGMALATTIAGWVNAAMLGVTLYKRGIFVPDARLKRDLAGMLLAACMMAFALFFGGNALSSIWDDRLMRVLAMAGLVGSGALIFFGICWKLKIVDKKLLKLYIGKS